MNRIIYIDNIEEEQKQRFISVDLEVMTPQKLLKEKLEDTDALVVLCELNIDKEGKKKNRSDFYGVEFVQELRRKEFMGKVLFVSFVIEKFIINNKLGEIIKSIGHSFLRLPSNIKDWKDELKTILLLDKLSHYDIVNHFSGENAIIGEKIHAIESKIVLKKIMSNEDKKACIQIIKSTYNAKQQKYDSVLTKFDEINDGKSAIQFVKNKCYNLFPKKNGKHSDKLKPVWSKWKVLWLDDEETDKSLLKVELESEARNRLKVELVKSYLEAMDVWEEDKKTTQEICLVIADYRLNDIDENCKDKQGYHFLKDIAKQGTGIGLIAYSGLTRRFLFESFKYYGVQVNIFSKIDFNQDNPDNINYLADQIVQMGDNHWIMRNNQPQSKFWLNNISSNYFVFKENINYYSFEQSLSKQVRQNLDVFIEKYNNCRTEFELWNLTFTDTFNVRTSGGFPTGSVEKSNDSVKEVLTTRRFAIGLYAFLKSTKNNNKELLSEINYEDYLKFVLLSSDLNKSNPVKWDDDFDYFIRGEEVEIKNKKGEKVKTRKGGIKYTPSLKNATANSGLTFDSSWPFGLLPEEYAWLECDSGLEIRYLEENSKYWNKIEDFRNVFKTNFSKSNFLQSILIKGKINSGTKIVYFNDDFEPFIRSINNIKDTLKTIHKNLDYKNEKYEYQLTDFVMLLKGLLSKIDNNSPGNIKTIANFINTLKSKSKGKIKKLKRNESIIEEYIRLFAPWELFMPKQNTFETIEDFEKEKKKRKENLINACLNFKAIKSKWKVYKMINSSYKELIANDESSIQLINRAIYLGIDAYKSDRNSKLEIFYENSTSEYLVNLGSVDERGSEIYNSDYYKISEKFSYTLELENLFISKMRGFDFVPKSNIEVFIMNLKQLPNSFTFFEEKKNGIKHFAIISFDISNYPESTIDKFDAINILESIDFFGIPL